MHGPVPGHTRQLGITSQDPKQTARCRLRSLDAFQAASPLSLCQGSGTGREPRWSPNPPLPPPPPTTPAVLCPGPRGPNSVGLLLSPSRSAAWDSSQGKTESRCWPPESGFCEANLVRSRPPETKDQDKCDSDGAVRQGGPGHCPRIDGLDGSPAEEPLRDHASPAFPVWAKTTGRPPPCHGGLSLARRCPRAKSAASIGYAAGGAQDKTRRWTPARKASRTGRREESSEPGPPCLRPGCGAGSRPACRPGRVGDVSDLSQVPGLKDIRPLG